MRLRRDALGVRFRRQHVIDRFIADFYCAERGLVVEVDGPVHEGRGELDAERDCLFLTKGLVVPRAQRRRAARPRRCRGAHPCVVQLASLTFPPPCQARRGARGISVSRFLF